ncbi:MAG: LysR family transcriptional regulator [Clostridia bacterium]|nr:LysR family transcriptional regulator [Clostridia bacterium]
MNRYEVFMKVIETGSFTNAANELNYTQSAVSQMIHTLEEELHTVLLLRKKGGIVLTPDGLEYLPYIRSIFQAHRELLMKYNEMQGLQEGIIRIGTFTSVSRNWLPQVMKDFKKDYPNVQFELIQGEYTNISQWIKEGTVDFGFVNPIAVTDLETIEIEKDRMLAVLPKDHELASHKSVTIQEMSEFPYILLDEGSMSVPMNAFHEHGLKPQVEYKVYDDYTIMSMVEQGLGVSILYSLLLKNYKQDFVTKEITPRIERSISIAYKNKKTLPVASRYFMEYILNRLKS